MSNSNNYLVGHCRPPAHAQFKKGQSGNPKGRPKGKRDGTDISTLLGEPVTAKIRGTTRQISPLEACFRQLAKRAVDGDLNAVLEFIKICKEFDLITRPRNPYCGVLVAPKGVDFQEWANELFGRGS